MLKNPTKLGPGSLKHVECICDYCGQEFTQPNRNRIKGHKIIEKDACKDCRMKKREESSILKYGTKVPSQSTEIRKKSSLTKGGKGINVEDYKDQILDMYNQPNMSINNIAQKLNITRSVLIAYLQKLGLDTTGDVQQKRTATVMEKYGKEHIMQTEAAQQKFKQTMSAKTKEEKEKITEKIKKTNLEKYGYEFPVQDPAKQAEFQEKRKQTRILNGHEVTYEGKTAKELAAEIGINLSSFHQRVRKVGIEMAAITKKYETYIEMIMDQLLTRLNVEYKTQQQVGSKIADFLIPSDNLIIECDGLYWHSDAVIKDKNYHFNKRQLYIDKGYFPLFFREDELNDKIQIVESIIINKLHMSNRIGARKCKIVELKRDAGKKFIAQNHLMGVGAGHYLALEYNGEIVCVLNIKRVKNREYEISRFCCSYGTTVSGGFSKLLSYALSKFDMSHLHTFIDQRYGDGSYLSNFNFERKSSHPSFRWTNGINTWGRMSFRGNSGYEKGLVKLWDCGQTRWTRIL